MKIQSIVPFPLGPHDSVSYQEAMKMVGQKFPATDERHNKIGESEIIDVDWRGPNEVLLTIEMEIDPPFTEVINSKARYSIEER